MTRLEFWELGIAPAGSRTPLLLRSGRGAPVARVSSGLARKAIWVGGSCRGGSGEQHAWGISFQDFLHWGSGLSEAVLRRVFSAVGSLQGCCLGVVVHLFDGKPL